MGKSATSKTRFGSLAAGVLIAGTLRNEQTEEPNAKRLRAGGETVDAIR
jgi:hypothetical protein